MHSTVLLETTPTRTRKKYILLFSSRAETNNPVNRRKGKPFRSLAERDSLTLKQTCSQNGSAMCVQNFNDSRGLAIRITYRISLRSSSLWEPRHPLLKVVKIDKEGFRHSSYLAFKLFGMIVIHYKVAYPDSLSG